GARSTKRGWPATTAKRRSRPACWRRTTRRAPRCGSTRPRCARAKRCSRSAPRPCPAPSAPRRRSTSRPPAISSRPPPTSSRICASSTAPASTASPSCRSHATAWARRSTTGWRGRRRQGHDRRTGTPASRLDSGFAGLRLRPGMTQNDGMNVAGPPVRAIAPDLLNQFIALVGAKYAVTDPAEQEQYLVESRNLYRGTSPAVLRPGSVAEVAAILKLASETGTPIVPQGGNTGLVGGQIPHGGEIVLSLTRLDRIREGDATSNTMTCEAGVILMNAQNAAAEARRLFPLSLGAEGSCTSGGNLSTNAGGTGALAYGVARELVLGLEVVLADGRVLSNLRKLKKDNTGYDLRHIFIGAEGTLGVI